ncbi:uncharacterized protein EV154DRAFT_525503 [Mucor mucedo]|uniref:uncharacterized protein n=1 Tax=Mucor mucedo TaxID=29922 RepID=UPI00221F2AB4|nr:uncharacterized protein EV154DRAFT_525503 [Mucor mucedo]KAI7877321.1 hypothetical protein EV154DRAFT_525503 [Mucor mucedo]
MWGGGLYIMFIFIALMFGSILFKLFKANAVTFRQYFFLSWKVCFNVFHGAFNILGLGRMDTGYFMCLTNLLRCVDFYIRMDYRTVNSPEDSSTITHKLHN